MLNNKIRKLSNLVEIEKENPSDKLDKKTF